MSQTTQPSALWYIAPAVIGAVSALLVAFVTDFFTRSRERRLRQQAAALQYRERQLGEFYGPLHSLIEQIQSVYKIKTDLLSAPGANRLSTEQRGKIDTYFWTKYFNPLHASIRRLFRSKLYLLGKSKIPESFVKYYRHSVQEKAQMEIARDLQIDTSFLEGVEYPRDLDTTVREALDQLMIDYQRDVESLKG